MSTLICEICEAKNDARDGVPVHEVEIEGYNAVVFACEKHSFCEINKYFLKKIGVTKAEAEAAGARRILDTINPPHYKAHPSGIECIQVTEHMNFCLGNAVKYIWRAGLKGDAVQDLEKAKWYLEQEISRRKNR